VRTYMTCMGLLALSGAFLATSADNYAELGRGLSTLSIGAGGISAGDMYRSKFSTTRCEAQRPLLKSIRSNTDVPAMDVQTKGRS
jgi:hypothetical protein